MVYLTLWSGLAIGHFVYQWFQPIPNWESACERSFFQAIAVACCYALSKIYPAKRKEDTPLWGGKFKGNDDDSAARE